MNFSPFKQAIQKRFKTMSEGGPLFQALVDKDQFWELYLSSFPEGTNPVFRERTEHDCSCCRSFVKHAGTMVQIVDGEIRSMWDLDAGEYQDVANALSAHLKTCLIENVFLHPEPTIGTDKNRELDGNTGQVTEWQHFFITLPNNLQSRDIGKQKGEFNVTFTMCFRALTTFTVDALETVKDLISQNSLYRGEEKKNLVNTFLAMKLEFDKINTSEKKNFFVWNQVVGSNAWACRIRGDVIGTLIEDLSEGKDLEVAVKCFEDKVSGTNYKRPTSLITPKMKEQAKEALQKLGLMPSLDRRFANLDDITISNLIFANRDIKRKLTTDVFDDLPTKTSNKKFDKMETVTAEEFFTKIVPTATSLEIFIEGRHSGNFVSLVAPEDATAPTLFKWDNPYSWSYSGDVADSIKEKVKAAGGNVTGEICCRLAWHNYDDLDLHLLEPGNKETYYLNKGPSPCGAKLDVDMNAGSGKSRKPVENIFFQYTATMRDGEYKFYVQQFCSREKTDVGFEVELDVQGEIHYLSFPHTIPTGRNIDVATLKVRQGKIEVIPHLPSTLSSREIWGVKTMEFRPITAIMLSPNFWGENAVGNKHYFFMVEGCKNDGSARGFYNEFLKSELEPHRKTMELVGAKVRTEVTDNQMSGLGFSSTQKNDVIIRVHGSFQRDIRVIF